ncbi:MAG: CotH kinase family protein [Prevotella sp.]|nr:CotH kinase family protein [Prevotella sp.]
MKELSLLVLSFFISLFSFSPVEAQEAVTISEVREAGLRIVEITTEKGEEPAGKVILKPGTQDNFNITDANKVACQIIITLGRDTLYNSGPWLKDSLGATIRINGNTSAYYSNPLNMPYKLKLEKKADLLSRGDDQKYKDKNWRLLKDATSMNTITGMKVSQLLGLEWTPAYVPCNVIINGDYRGCYLLMETVRRNPRCRIDCDKQEGYIVERDPYWWKESQWFSSGWYDGSSMYRWTWKYPDEDSITTEKELYIQQYIIRTEESLATGEYENYINVTSFARWLLAHDILGTRDSGGANMYLKKYDSSDTTLLEMPCLWDFDSSYGITPGSFSRLHTSSNAYFSALLNSTNRAFARAYVSVWNKFIDSLYDKLTAFVNEYPSTDEGKALETSRTLNERRWNTQCSAVETDALKTLQWLQSHIEAMDRQIQLIDITDTSIQTTTNSQSANKDVFYNLNGVRICAPAKNGIVICKQANGKVIIMTRIEGSLTTQ